MSKFRKTLVKAVPQQSTARSCRAGCGSTTVDMSAGRAGWQPCPALITYSLTLDRRRHRLISTQWTGIMVRLGFRRRAIHLPAPRGQVKPPVGLRWQLSRSSARRTEMHRDQVQAAGALRWLFKSPDCCQMPETNTLVVVLKKRSMSLSLLVDCKGFQLSLHNKWWS